MRTIQGKWVTDPEYRSLLFFTQALDEMVWEEAREIYRIPALNTYHRCLEVVGAASEIIAAGLPNAILDPMFEELLYLAERDPVVKRSYPEQFGQLQSLIKITNSYSSRISAVKLFYSKIQNQYLRNCRTLIGELINSNVISHDPDLYICIGIYSSYLLNEGFSAFYISNCVFRHFLSRVVNDKRIREIQNFFAYFPTASSRFEVRVRVTSSLKDLVIGSGAAKAGPGHAGRVPAKNSTEEAQHLVVFDSIEARDFFSARMKCESILSTARGSVHS